MSQLPTGQFPWWQRQLSGIRMSFEADIVKVRQVRTAVKIRALKMTKIFALSAAFLLAFLLPAYAYLDLGTGSMIVNVIIAAIFGGLVAIKVQWYKLKKLFSRSRGKGLDSDQSD